MAIASNRAHNEVITGASRTNLDLGPLQLVNVELPGWIARESGDSRGNDGFISSPATLAQSRQGAPH
jgi:hypothetical protein